MNKFTNDIQVNIYTQTSERKLNRNINSIFEEKQINNTFLVNPIIYYLQTPIFENGFMNTNIRDLLNSTLYQNNELKRNENIIPEIKIKKYKDIKEKYCDNCVICQNNFEEKDKVAFLNCKHIYHNDCITNWSKYKQECPICKNPIPYNLKNDE